MMYEILTFIEGPLVQITLIALVVGVSLRILFFVGAMIASVVHQRPAVSAFSAFGNLLRSVLPLHAVGIQRPIYSGLRYLFHLCLVIVPIWYSGHIALWEESELGWYWTPMSDLWCDRMTLIVIGLGLLFALRRLVIGRVRRNSSWHDHLLIAIAIMPYLTGYLYTTGTLDQIAFFRDNLYYLHIFSGEVMLLTIVVLFVRTRLNPDTCIGCAACEISCPTHTLAAVDAGAQRLFRYGHYQCICCATCVAVCPQRAAELRHAIGLGRFFQVFKKQVIRSVPRSACSQCGAIFGPEPQVQDVLQKIAAAGHDTRPQNLCPRCRKKTAHQSRYFPERWRSLS